MLDEQDISADKLAEIYIKIRDKRSELKQEYDEKDSQFKEQMELITDRLLKLCESQNANSINTNSGTIIRKVDTRYWTSDWESFYSFVKEHDAFPLLYQRINTLNMKQFLEENPDLMPAGLQSDSHYVVQIRRSKK